ncbi:MAG: S9 family peptidase [Acidobacteriota bacterium]
MDRRASPGAAAAAGALDTVGRLDTTGRTGPKTAAGAASAIGTADMAGTNKSAGMSDAARAAGAAGGAAPSDRFLPADIFQLEWASDPRISPDGSQVVYVRRFMDIMTDRRRSHLWIVDARGGHHRPLTDGADNEWAPRFSPDGTRLVYLGSSGGATQIHALWLESGASGTLTRLQNAPSNLAFSPDGTQVAFTMKVREPRPPFATLPARPEGATWADPPIFIDKLHYRADGAGYLEDGWVQIFVIPADGGTPRQLTSGPFNHGGTPAWTPDGTTLIFSANRHADAEFVPLNTEVYAVSVADGTLTVLTDRDGPDSSPVVSPDGTQIAYVGFDDRRQGYQVTQLYVMNRDGSHRRVLTADLDRDVEAPRWDRAGRGLFFQYDDHGNTHLGHVSLTGKRRDLARDVGGESLGRPYSSGSFSVARNDTLVYTAGAVDRPADVAIAGGDGHRLTRLNDDLLGTKRLGAVEELTFASSFDDRAIQGWLITPPDFDAVHRYPLILEIHGGPFANYGDRFAGELQLYAAAGYVVLYINPRGSTSYGETFGNLIHHHYPGEDYDDLMSGVDAVLARGFINPEKLFVTGGSGGGVLSSWIVGHTDRFSAAVVAKPVINWTSWVLTADLPTFAGQYWFPGYPWEAPDQYRQRSPLSFVDHVKTPTMVLTGESDYRTPISESEQFYTALKLRKIPAALVRMPGASHGIANRPSQLIGKAAHVLAWFARYGGPPADDED